LGNNLLFILLIVNKTILNLFLPSNQAVREAKARIGHELFGGICNDCKKKYQSNFAFHHLDYDPDRKTYKDFKGTLTYNRYILPEVVAFPQHFELLCRACHNRIDNYMTGLSKVPKDTLARLYVTAFMTTKKPRGGNANNSPVTKTTPMSLENVG